MAWIEKLHATYEACKGHEPPGAEPLMPVSHSTQQAQIEIVIDGCGNFRRASVIPKEDSTTLIPCTEASGGRAGSMPVNHPLCDKLQYVAGDFLAYGGEVTSGFANDPVEPHREFLKSLTTWAGSSYAHPKLQAVLSYVKPEDGMKPNGIVADLVREGLLPALAGKLLKSWDGVREDMPAIFKVLGNTQSPEDAFVRWRIEDGSSLATGTWEDQELMAAWDSHYKSQQTLRGVCMVTGEEHAPLAQQHPAKLRNGADKAKLISANDKSGFTFRGRFTDPDGVQACTVGYVVTQKAHSALRWLIARQGYKSGKQVFLAWAVAGKPVPDPWANSLSLILDYEKSESQEERSDEHIVGDVGQAIARRLNRAIAGYGAKLDPTDDIVVMGLDAATTGRTAITFYRELKGSEFLGRIQAWHEQYSWHQSFGEEGSFPGAPAPKDIAEAAFGRELEGKSGEKLRAATVERLIPCIVDGQALPRDLVQSSTRRACNRIGMEKTKRGKRVFEDEWEKTLGIACGLFRGWSKSQGKEYAMALEEDRTSKDYLYGRLLAVADSIESYVLGMVEKPRDTAAAHLMQRFADHPYSTWRTIELRLRPYISRLRSSERKKVRAFLASREKTMDEIHCRFASADFSDDSPLSGEFLLGYHCQRAVLFAGSNPQTSDQSTLEDSAS
ncbi:MAG: type I-C CRISPR-associated protein Cas8c/Csd1 [Rhodocyclales bacterium GWA2_65_19]|nr:MAG: type I-C CRISPR-associated protein Cas8c/Csd1 [Rhodocyclales bacterium GWA2_65_19]